ncbi:hypothetical protein F5Y14DRAFT_184692 [Nemania sp. NC0429]|nr:hypothetical protein F5Y14DRAFT_184692 [Nemania sp. NC0429]
MEGPLVCASLRKRSAWAGLTSSLLQSKSSCGKWKETQLDTHDVAIPLPTQRVLRTILMSPPDVALTGSTSRIERLHSLTGGQDTAIIFLLVNDDDQQNAVSALMTLQLKLIGNWDLPIIPVESVVAMPASLEALRRQLVCPVASSPKALSPTTCLLPFCSDGTPLADHTVNLITDTTSGFRNLVAKLSSDTVFESEIAPLLGDDAHTLRRFWTGEYLVD